MTPAVASAATLPSITAVVPREVRPRKSGSSSSFEFVGPAETGRGGGVGTVAVLGSSVLTSLLLAPSALRSSALSSLPTSTVTSSAVTSSADGCADAAAAALIRASVAALSGARLRELGRGAVVTGGSDDGVDVGRALGGIDDREAGFGGGRKLGGRVTATGAGRTLTGAGVSDGDFGGCDSVCFGKNPDELGFGTVLTGAGAA